MFYISRDGNYYQRSFYGIVDPFEGDELYFFSDLSGFVKSILALTRIKKIKEHFNWHKILMKMKPLSFKIPIKCPGFQHCLLINM